MTTSDIEESEAERAAQSLLRTQEDLCDDPQNIAAYVLCEVGAEIVRALGRIEAKTSARCLDCAADIQTRMQFCGKMYPSGRKLYSCAREPGHDGDCA